MRLTDTNNEVLVAKWLDNKYVIVGMNYDMAKLLGKVQQWKQRGVEPVRLKQRQCVPVTISVVL